MKSGETGQKLGDLIKKAIHDLEITHSEYEHIMAEASADGHIDAQEKSLLAQLQEMVGNGTVKRVKG